MHTVPLSTLEEFHLIKHIVRMTDPEIIAKQHPTGRHEYFSLFIYLLAYLLAYYLLFCQASALCPGAQMKDLSRMIISATDEHVWRSVE